MLRVVLYSGLLFFAASFTADAQFKLSIVEGAACAQSAAHIEALENYNNSVHDEIGDSQASSDRDVRNSAHALLVHFNRMVAYRKRLIDQYDLLCARGTMEYTEYRKVCRPQSSGISFEDTVFCKPLKEFEQ